MAISTAASANYWCLKNSGISKRVGQSALQHLAHVMETKTHHRDEMLYPPETGVSFLLEGCIGISRIDPSSGKEIILYIVKPGEFFGNSWSKNGNGQASVARALQNSRVGHIDGQSLHELMLDDAFREQMQRSLESRLTQLENRMEELLFNKVKTRLAQLLLRLSRDFSGDCPTGEGVSIAVSLTQSDIACLIAASREITSLTLNELRRAGVVAFHGRRICVHDTASLKTLSITG